jgi:NAD(P)H-hydrate repair Nnr-like enzyme with NAD(P)H-hydrate dehydratase domain
MKILTLMISAFISCHYATAAAAAAAATTEAEAAAQNK